MSLTDEHTLLVLDIESGEQVGPTLEGHAEIVRSIAVSAGGRRVVSGSDDRTVRVWDTQTGEHGGYARIGHTDGVYGVAVSADGRRMVSRSWDRTMRVWDAKRAMSIGSLKHSLGQELTEQCIRYLGEGYVESSENSGSAYFTRGDSIIYCDGTSEKVIARMEAEIQSFAVSETLPTAAGLRDGTVAFLEIVE